MSDIYVWLRQHQTVTTPSGFSYEIERFKEAADEIERLRAEVARLNTFLHPIGVVVNQAVRGE